MQLWAHLAAVESASQPLGCERRGASGKNGTIRHLCPYIVCRSVTLTIEAWQRVEDRWFIAPWGFGPVLQCLGHLADRFAYRTEDTLAEVPTADTCASQNVQSASTRDMV